jgi:pimeloyl-ACP methyl ester carboxylesterase
MPNVTANGIQIEYETFGEPGRRPLMLIMGLGAQMIHWDDEFCQRLADRGHFVIRFDNRDAGLSSQLDHLGEPDARAAMARRLRGEKVEAPYTLKPRAAAHTGTGLTPQISSAYCRIVRSLENFPMFATFRIDFFVHAARSR